MATIKPYTLKSGEKRYMFKVYLGQTPSGKRIETSRRGFKTKKEAQNALRQLQIDYDQGKIFHNANPDIKTFGQLASAWKKIHYTTIKPTTKRIIDSYYNNHIGPFFEPYNLSNINSVVAQNFVLELHAKGLKTYRQVCIYAAMILDYAVFLGILQENPFKKVTYPASKTKETKNNFYTKEELADFLNIVKDTRILKEYALFHVLAYTGCRKSEALGLKWNDIDQDNKTLAIERGIVPLNNESHISTPKTANSIRKIFLDDKTLDLLQRLKIETMKGYLEKGLQFDNPFIFEKTPNQLPHFNYAELVLRSVYNHNLKLRKITLHGFRHTHASLLFAAGASPKEVQHRLGHASISMTLDIYTHLIKTQEEKTAGMFAKYMEL